MARYRVVELSYVNERIAEPGEEVDFVGLAGTNLALIGDEAAAREELLAALRAEAQTVGIIDKNHSPHRLAQLISEAKQKLAS